MQLGNGFGEDVIGTDAALVKSHTPRVASGSLPEIKCLGPVKSFVGVGDNLIKLHEDRSQWSIL